MFATCAPCAQLYLTEAGGGDRCPVCNGPLLPTTRDEALRLVLRARQSRPGGGSPAMPSGPESHPDELCGEAPDCLAAFENRPAAP